MSEDVSNRNLMLAVMAGLKSGKLEALFAAIRADVVWKVMAPREFFRFGGSYEGVTGVKEYTALLFSDYHLARLNPAPLRPRAKKCGACSMPRRCIGPAAAMSNSTSRFIGG
jgi:hypothetical protein